MANVWEQLQWREYRLTYQAITPIHLPAFTGSMWHGALGHALRESVCCQQRPHHADDLYQRWFKPQANVSVAPQALKVRNPPVPYIFRVSFDHAKTYQPNACFSVNFLLLQASDEDFTDLLTVFRHIGKKGLGKKQGKARLLRVEQCFAEQSVLLYANDLCFLPTALSMPSLPICPEQAVLRFITPLQLSDPHKPLNAERLLMGLIRRISLLHQCYAPNDLALDFFALKQCAQSIEMITDLQQVHWQRYSSRQKKSHPLSGYVGTIILTGEYLSVFWDYLYWGQWLHLGKQTSMGLGRYFLETNKE